MKAAITFREVSFAYPDAEIDALREVTLDVPEGAFVLVTEIGRAHV